MVKKKEKDYIRTDRVEIKFTITVYLITGIGNIIDLKDKKSSVRRERPAW